MPHKHIHASINPSAAALQYIARCVILIEFFEWQGEKKEIAFSFPKKFLSLASVHLRRETCVPSERQCLPDYRRQLCAHKVEKKNGIESDST